MLTWWRRRYWKRDEAALAEFQGQLPATLITGATRGIGYEFTRLVVRGGSAVVLIARSESDLQTTRDRLLAEVTGTDGNAATSITTIAIDLTNPSAASSIRDQLGSLNLYADTLINNAGIGLSGRFADASPAEVDHLVELNISSLTRLTRTFLPEMLVRGQGGIINVASLGGLTPGPYQAAYYASKAYVISLTQALSYENRGQGVQFTVIAPGPVETQFHAQMDAERAFYRRFLPAMTARAVARSAMFWYKMGRTVVVPGVFNSILAICLWILPAALTNPVVAFLLNPREDE
ncbi:MAG: SDR family NAD(P)-dependent oxidoreductase, partial [Pseudomonadota bacterium]